ncbi:hypothetical protein DFQ05_0559 [Winogradskyella wandonensis]|uniref:Lipoprotein n=1 Tax=Winogradskyella wandonensis TaxID=1442586 RepID=A0A4R1KV55_9FLAO|nr:DUF6452 family protein [Winogradskyella wandonensis]TCK69048.1 hypothetical protein DFQ05_0559 [Winogradskyella wandonensis]
MKKQSYLFLLITLIFFSCERDDICAEGTPTTPRLLIEFFDAVDTDVPKTVTRLSVYADDPDIVVPDDNDISGAILVEPFGQERVFNRNTNTIGLPFLIESENQLITQRYFFEKDTNLRLNDDDTTDSNIDIIEVTYETEFIYISRACGFKSIFKNVVVEIIDDGNNWIQDIQYFDALELPITVENEDAPHVQIFH